MDEKLILNNGTEIDGHLIEMNDRLFLYIYNLTLAEVFELLIVPENTMEIISIQYGQESTVRGYDHLSAISEETVNMVSAVMKK